MVTISSSLYISVKTDFPDTPCRQATEKARVFYAFKETLQEKLEEQWIS